jgi:ribosome silencing factor RsfS/YbeB/iojap
LTAKKTPRPKAAPAKTPRAAASKPAPARKTATAAKTAARSPVRSPAKSPAKTASRTSAQAAGKSVKTARRPAGTTTAARPPAMATAWNTPGRAVAPRSPAAAAKTAKPKAAGAPKAPRQRTQPKPARATDVVARLRDIVIKALEDLKARDIVELDVTGRTSIADIIVVAGGTSSRHVKSIADEVIKQTKKAGLPPLGVEGQREAEWVLVDLGDIVVHIMLPRAREFYGLERMWSVDGDTGSAAAV